ncbi:MAG TPA: response regulator transcription factor [Candidatus Saccharimonadales bacterium]|nr:response regulator transcription factor [Candidatus Saccharimonadales bacterium]
MRILVVEDEKKLADSIKRGLEQQSYAVDTAYDSDTGLALALNEPYDLIILDRMLPGKMEGVGIIEKLRAGDIQTPVLLLTAKSSVIDRAYGLNSGADDYLVKPFAFVELIARVRALLRRPAQAKETKLTYKDLILDPHNKTVKRSGQTIDLTSKEFALLEYLMGAPGQLQTKDNLIHHVWDYDADILPNTVEVYIGYLRNKVDKPFKSDNLINTKRGFGYYFGEMK